MTGKPLSFLFNPRSVALIGATATAGKVGERIVSNLVDNGFAGGAYPVNRTATYIRGIRCYRNIEAIPEPIDVGYVLVPAQAAVDVVWALGRAGAASAIVAAAGFDETNTDEGRRLQASLVDASATTGIRIVGPNCNGVYSATNHHRSVSIQPTAGGWMRGV